MKLFLIIVTSCIATLLAALLALQIRIALGRPNWEYKVESLTDISTCYDNDPKHMPPEPALAKEGWLDAPEFMRDIRKQKIEEARTAWASLIMTGCLNRMGSEGWEIISIDSQTVCLRRLKP
jgi:hypothetical protein